MNHTAFTANAQESKGNSTLLPVLLIVIVVVAIVIFATSDGQFRVVGPGPLLILALLMSRKNKKSDVTLYVNQDGTDFEFGYKNTSNESVGPYPILEYTNWCVERASTQNGYKYDLILQINTIKKNTQEPITIYFKNEIVARNPPAGWNRSTEKIQDKPGVFIVPNLAQLVSILDAEQQPESTNA